MTLDKVAIIPSIGIGDALMMMVASHRFYSQNYTSVTFSKPLIELEGWFPGHKFHPRPSIEDLEEVLKEYDLIIFQHENSPFAKALLTLYHSNKLKALSVFYAIYEEHKHFPLTPLDRVFDEKKPMVDNIARAISSILGLNNVSKNNGLVVPEHLIHRRIKHRVLIHPSSQAKERIWPKEKFLEIAKWLEAEGFLPVFVTSKDERKEWLEYTQGHFSVPLFEKLSDLATFAYESGFLIGNDSMLGHLCSNLQIPTVVLSSKKRHILLWRPGWYRGEIVTAPSWIPNFKGSRLREKQWKRWIKPKHVITKFKKILSKESF